jgi:hypothetical protein
MAYTEEEKLQIAKNALKHKIMQIETWADFKLFALNVSTAKIKNLVRAALAINREDHVNSQTTSTTGIENVDEFYVEVGEL